jgi:hypothetical protein
MVCMLYHGGEWRRGPAGLRHASSADLMPCGVFVSLPLFIPPTLPLPRPKSSLNYHPKKTPRITATSNPATCSE